MRGVNVQFHSEDSAQSGKGSEGSERTNGRRSSPSCSGATDGVAPKGGTGARRTSRRLTVSAPALTVDRAEVVRHPGVANPSARFAASKRTTCAARSAKTPPTAAPASNHPASLLRLVNDRVRSPSPDLVSPRLEPLSFTVGIRASRAAGQGLNAVVST